MELEVKKEADIIVLTPVGRIDTSCAKQFEEGVISNIENATKTIIKFDKIDYISSAGLRVILIAGKKMTAKKGVLTLCLMSPKIQEVFKMSGFDKILKIFPTFEDAKGNLN